MKLRDNFVVFILSHGRANNIKTLNTLKKANYNGDWFIVIDNEDKTANEYYEKYGKDKVIMFDKLEKSKEFDTADNFDDRRTIVYARNACFDIAEKLGYRYFLELDDDYTSLGFRKVKDDKFIEIHSRNANSLFEAMLRFLDDTGAMTVALAQGGDFIGGSQSSFFRKGISRKAMNTFFCDVEKRFNFIGRVNEDVNTYVRMGNIGRLLLTVSKASITQVTTQASTGGMTEQYLDSGTYVKSFYTILFMPSSVKIRMMGGSNKRLHHSVSWNNTVPKIMNERYKKRG